MTHKTGFRAHLIRSRDWTQRCYLLRSLILLLTLTFCQRCANNFNVDLPRLRTGTDNKENPFLLQLPEQKQVFDAVKQTCSTKQREKKVLYSRSWWEEPMVSSHMLQRTHGALGFLCAADDIKRLYFRSAPGDSHVIITLRPPLAANIGYQQWLNPAHLNINEIFWNTQF